MKQKNKEPVRTIDRASVLELSLQELFQQVQMLSQRSVEELRSSSQARELGRWRQAFAYIARKWYRRPVVEIAKVLGRDATTASRMIERIDREKSEQREMSQLLEIIKVKNDGAQ